MNSNSPSVEKLLREEARALGFIAIGFSAPATPPHFDQFVAWLSQGRFGDMAWVARHVELRKDPRRLMEGCKTIISLAYPYSNSVPVGPDGLRAARFTEGLRKDYHIRLRELGKKLAGAISEVLPGSRSRVCVDSAPLLERSIAYSAGIGFFGKNTMLIIPGYGSYFFLVEILTTAPIVFSPPQPIMGQCGQCKKCLDACPTGALVNPCVHDSRNCLSYLTIESNRPLDPSLGSKMKRCFFGCDICQSVCPFNEGEEDVDLALPSGEEILNMNEKQFKDMFGQTAFSRAGLEKIKDNVRAALL